MDRRDFLKNSGLILSGSACGSLPLLTACRPTQADQPGILSGKKWAMVIDLNRCRPDCDACLDACRKENNVALYGDKRWDIHWIRKVTFRDRSNSKEESVLLLCNHCENPPCAQVCPVQATYKREDGIVLIDQHRCIGCRYCMIACPYGARFFNYKDNPDWPNKDYPKRSHGVAESCNFCAHLLDQGKPPACVKRCEEIGAKALTFGNLEDPESAVYQKIHDNPVKRLREDLGTEPRVYYIGL